MTPLTNTLLSIILLSSVSGEYAVFCPESAGDNTKWPEMDIGLNIWSSSTTRADDCFLRHSTIYQSHSNIGTEWIDPSRNLLVVSHGWQSGWKELGYDHYISDKWSVLVGSTCVSQGNDVPNPIEICEPTDHNAQYWLQQNWSVIFLDWQYHAAESEVQDAEAKLYVPLEGRTTVIDKLYNHLMNVLNLTKWNGNELRFVGHSLGSQVALNLASRIKTDTTHSFDTKLRRIALLDHFFSLDEQQYFPQKDPGCTDKWSNKCDHFRTGEYARFELIQNIRTGDNPPVIETYRTSPSSSNVFVGDENDELNKMTVFTQLSPWYYNSVQLKEKHNTAFALYLHCMKWVSYGPLADNAPSCRMDTDTLKKKCLISNWWDYCQKEYTQTDGQYTTWDFDDKFEQSWILEVASIPPTRSPIFNPTKHRTKQPTKHPTKQPTKQPTIYPTKYPTESGSEHGVKSVDHEKHTLRIIVVVLSVLVVILIASILGIILYFKRSGKYIAMSENRTAVVEIL
eukprot:777369_1